MFNQLFIPFLPISFSSFTIANRKTLIKGKIIPLSACAKIIAGTGLVHVNKPLYPAIERATAKGVHMFMCVQTLWGYAHMFVYDTGRDLMAKGVIPAMNMMPEVAYIKLGWVLGQTTDPVKVREMMLSPINDEITPREPYNGYLIFQGGVKEVEEFIKKVHK